MPTIVWFLVFVAAACATLITRHAVVALRGLLILCAVVGAFTGESWAFHRYGLFPNAQPYICAHSRGGDPGLRAGLPGVHKSPRPSAFRLHSRCTCGGGWVFSGLTPLPGFSLSAG